jgi:hypothetical protein
MDDVDGEPAAPSVELRLDDTVLLGPLVPGSRDGNDRERALGSARHQDARDDP